MKWLGRICALIVAVIAAAGGSYLITAYMGTLNMMGSCFEGACGYVALYFWFPLWWGILTLVFVGLLVRRWMRA